MIKFSRFHKIFQEVPVKAKNFKDKIFEARQKSSKSLKIFTLKNFRLYGITSHKNTWLAHDVIICSGTMFSPVLYYIVNFDK